MELLDEFPIPYSDIPCVIAQDDTAWDAIRKFETQYTLVYDIPTRRFLEAWATHPADLPDSEGYAGRLPSRARRQILSVRIAFARSTAALSPENLFASAQVQEFAASVPAGVRASWSIQTERTYTDSGSAVDSGRVFSTTRRTVPAGIEYSGMAGTLPGGRCRASGLLSLSAFSGTGTERSTQSVPIEIDGERGKWMQVLRFQSGNADAAVIFRNLGLSIGVSGEWLSVWFRID